MATYYDVPDPWMRGDTLLFPPFRMEDEQGNPEDLSGQSWFLTLKRSPNSLDDEAELKVVLTLDDGTDGWVNLRAEHEATKDLRPGFYYYDIQRVIPPAGSGSPFVQTELKGTIEVDFDITRRIEDA